MSLLVEPNGIKRWRFRYRFAGKPKMISLDVYTMFRLAESESALEKIATEWHQMKSAKWSAGYASDLMKAFQSDIFPYVVARAVREIEPLELLNVLRKVEKRGAFAGSYLYSGDILSTDDQRCLRVCKAVF